MAYLFRLESIAFARSVAPPRRAFLGPGRFRLRGVPQPNGSRMAERERRIRLAYLAGTEGWSRETTGRGLTEGELEGVVRRFR